MGYRPAGGRQRGPVCRGDRTAAPGPGAPNALRQIGSSGSKAPAGRDRSGRRSRSVSGRPQTTTSITLCQPVRRLTSGGLPEPGGGPHPVAPIRPRPGPGARRATRAWALPPTVPQPVRSLGRCGRPNGRGGRVVVRWPLSAPHPQPRRSPPFPRMPPTLPPQQPGRRPKWSRPWVTADSQMTALGGVPWARWSATLERPPRDRWPNSRSWAPLRGGGSHWGLAVAAPSIWWRASDGWRRGGAAQHSSERAVDQPAPVINGSGAF